MTTALAVPVLPQWQCHKKVQAARIAALQAVSPGAHDVEAVLEGGQSVPLPPWWVGKHEPQAGGYLVVYEDGYCSFSPSEAFEAGYAPVREEDATGDGSAVPESCASTVAAILHSGSGRVGV